MNKNDNDTRINMKKSKITYYLRAKDKELEWMTSAMETFILLTAPFIDDIMMEESLALPQFWPTKPWHPAFAHSTSPVIWTKSEERGSWRTHWRKYARLLVWRRDCSCSSSSAASSLQQPSPENLQLERGPLKIFTLPYNLLGAQLLVKPEVDGGYLGSAWLDVFLGHVKHGEEPWWHWCHMDCIYFRKSMTIRACHLSCSP